MRTQSISTRLFRLFVAMIVFVMAFSQIAGVAQAKDAPPPGKERVQIAPVGLDEVQNYYGRLGDIQGTVGGECPQV